MAIKNKKSVGSSSLLLSIAIKHLLKLGKAYLVIGLS